MHGFAQDGLQLDDPVLAPNERSDAAVTDDGSILFQTTKSPDVMRRKMQMFRCRAERQGDVESKDIEAQNLSFALRRGTCTGA